jgi:hypothetical protein
MLLDLHTDNSVDSNLLSPSTRIHLRLCRHQYTSVSAGTNTPPSLPAPEVIFSTATNIQLLFTIYTLAGQYSTPLCNTNQSLSVNFGLVKAVFAPRNKITVKCSPIPS